LASILTQEGGRSLSPVLSFPLSMAGASAAGEEHCIEAGSRCAAEEFRCKF